MIPRGKGCRNPSAKMVVTFLRRGLGEKNRRKYAWRRGRKNDMSSDIRLGVGSDDNTTFFN